MLYSVAAIFIYVGVEVALATSLVKYFMVNSGWSMAFAMSLVSFYWGGALLRLRERYSLRQSNASDPPHFDRGGSLSKKVSVVKTQTFFLVYRCMVFLIFVDQVQKKAGCLHPASLSKNHLYFSVSTMAAMRPKTSSIDPTPFTSAYFC